MFFNILVRKELLQANGMRTAKRFLFYKPKEPLESWLEQYSIVKKFKIRTYRSTFSEKLKWFKALKKSVLDQNVILAPWL
ncbi:hypothetical protein SNE_A15470 [Simkania negevensis Z]|uniref:Uncharacterized protein n=1 Tax=Simkania negevensis (strain ATCC VR-1471 / DSM 27360 / Z) TaxID=331113 RepID=F8L9A6_SIMNZ|nr:hypothetical protein SNE_A15470 [Simkania negevensis Z]